LSFKRFLAYILKESTVEFAKYQIDEIADEFIEGEPKISEIAVHSDDKAKRKNNDEKIDGINSESTAIDERTLRYDIIFYVKLPKTNEVSKFTINIEVQNTFYEEYPLPKRMVYYVSRLLSEQHTKDQKDEDYSGLHKVFSIWICTDVKGSKENSITRFALMPENIVGKARFKKENYDLLEIIVIGLGNNKESKDYNGLIKFLDVLLSKTIKSEEKKKIIENEYGIEMTKTVERVVNDMCSLGMGVYLDGIREGERNGERKGRKEGKKEGERKGRKEGERNACLNAIKKIMENLNFTAEQAMNTLGLSKKEQAMYSKLLEETANT
jgi:hypothetical protein